MAREVAPEWSPSRAAAEREAKRRPSFYTYMNLWPFVSVMLALLFIFIGDTTPDVHLSPSVDLPSGFHTTAQPGALAEDALTVYVTRDSRVIFRDMRVPAEELPEMVRDAVRAGAEKKVYLAVDSRAKYGDAAAVVIEISQAGVREVCIMATKHEK